MSRPVCPYCGSNTGYGEVICFKCGKHNESQRFRSKAVMSKECILIPDNITFNVKEFSLAAKQWLQIKCNLTVEQIRKHRIGYCPDVNKIFIPAIDKDVVRFYQLRALNEGGIKYVTYGSSRSYVITYVNNNLDYKRILVITEDNISAIRVAQHCNVIALSGTTLHKHEIPKLLQTYNTFVFWLDADDPGQKATDKNIRLLQEYTSKQDVRSAYLGEHTQKYEIFRVCPTKYELDPKCYLDHEIKQILQEITR